MSTEHDTARTESHTTPDLGLDEDRTVAPVASPVGITTEDEDAAAALSGPEDDEDDWDEDDWEQDDSNVSQGLLSVEDLRLVLQEFLDDERDAEPIAIFDERAEFLPKFLAEHDDDERPLIVGERGGHSALYGAVFPDGDDYVALQTEHGTVFVEPSQVILLVS